MRSFEPLPQHAHLAVGRGRRGRRRAPASSASRKPDEYASSNSARSRTASGSSSSIVDELHRLVGRQRRGQPPRRLRRLQARAGILARARGRDRCRSRRTRATPRASARGCVPTVRAPCSVARKRASSARVSCARSRGRPRARRARATSRRYASRVVRAAASRGASSNAVRSAAFAVGVGGASGGSCAAASTTRQEARGRDARELGEPRRGTRCPCPGGSARDPGSPSASTPNVCAVRSGRNANERERCRRARTSRATRTARRAPQYGCAELRRRSRGSPADVAASSGRYDCSGTLPHRRAATCGHAEVLLQAVVEHRERRLEVGRRRTARASSGAAFSLIASFSRAVADQLAQPGLELRRSSRAASRSGARRSGSRGRRADAARRSRRCTSA